MNESRAGTLGRWWFVLLPIGAALAMTFGVPLAYETLYPSDMNQNLAWTYRLANPGAFSGSAVIDYETWRYGQFGLRVLYWPLVHLMSPLLAGKLIALVLGACVFWLAAGIGSALWPERSEALPLAMLTIACMQRPTSLNFWAGIGGGMARSFEIPLILLYCLGVAGRRPWVAGLAVVLAVGFYPPIFLLLFATAILMMLLERKVSKAILPWLGGAALLAGAIYWHLQSAGYGPAPTLREALRLPVFGNGILPVVEPTLWGSLVAARFGFGLPLLLGALLGVAIFRREAGAAVWRLALALAIAAEVGFVGAYAVLFRIYFPNRYLTPLIVVVWLLALATLLAAIDALRITRHARRIAIAIGSAVLAMGFVANLVRSLPHDDLSAGHTGLYREPLGITVRSAIEALPFSAVIAGDPMTVSEVPLLCERQVFLDMDALLPYNWNYYRQVLANLHEQQQALYSADFGDALRFGVNHGVDALLVDRESFRTPGSPNNPWDVSYPDMVPPRDIDFAVLHPPARRVLADDGRLLLISLRGEAAQER